MGFVGRCRLTNAPHPEHAVATRFRALKKESPNIFQDIALADEPDGMPSVRITHSKV